MENNGQLENTQKQVCGSGNFCGWLKIKNLRWWCYSQKLLVSCVFRCRRWSGWWGTTSTRSWSGTASSMTWTTGKLRFDLKSRVSEYQSTWKNEKLSTSANLTPREMALISLTNCNFKFFSSLSPPACHPQSSSTSYLSLCILKL